MPVPSDMWLYCGVSALVAVVFCCCFHVTELIKLRYLRKLTSADRFSLSGISNDFSEGGSRSSTRRNTIIGTSPSGSGIGGAQGNFSIFTVITFPEGNNSNRSFQMKTITDQAEDGGLSEEQRSSLEDLLGSISSTRNVLKEETPPPKYDALFPSV